MAVLVTDATIVQWETESREPETSGVEFVPFPVDVLPRSVAEYVRQAAKSFCCNAAMFINVLLTGFALAIGNTRQIRMKPDWTEPSILWTLTICESGCKKTGVFSTVGQFFNNHERRAHESYKTAMSDYKARMARYKHEVTVWSKTGIGNPPAEPPKPRLQKLILVDTTYEATTYHLDGNIRGAGLLRDEGAGWFTSLGQYKKGGADEAFWNEGYDAKPYSQLRRGSETSIDIHRCSVSISVTIQPAVLFDILTNREKYVANGLLHRFNMVAPPEPLLTENELDASIDPELVQGMQTLFDTLLSLDFYRDSNGKEHTVDVDLTPEARELHNAIRLQYDSEKRNLPSDLRSYWSKIPGKIARIALILYEVRVALGEICNSHQVDADTMQSAIIIGRWYANEASRKYGSLGCSAESDDSRDQREILDAIRVSGGSASIAEIYGRITKYRDQEGREQLERILREDLRDKVQSTTVTSNGRPKEVFFFREEGQ
jgi:hypothetical protein